MRLDDAVRSARKRYVDTHPHRAALAKRAQAVLPGGNTRAVLHIDPFAFRVAAVNGGYLHDVDGRPSRPSSPPSDRIACILVEPMLGAGGCIPAEPAFLTALRRCADSTGSLLSFDEVMTSRLSWGGAQASLGITPDMTVLGKHLAGGLSFGALGGRREIMAAFDPAACGLVHGGTFNNNAFTMGVGAAVHEAVTAESPAALTARGDRLRSGLADIFASAPLPFTVTGWGSLCTIHPVNGPVRSAADV
jgi:glutamate-1-semialdehyde 2,1-aminomutase